jgi:hypothetical protein
MYAKMASNQEEAILAFNEETRTAVAAYLTINTHCVRAKDPIERARYGFVM